MTALRIEERIWDAIIVHKANSGAYDLEPPTKEWFSKEFGGYTPQAPNYSSEWGK